MIDLGSGWAITSSNYPNGFSKEFLVDLLVKLADFLGVFLFNLRLNKIKK
jgi:hypothetical protein